MLTQASPRHPLLLAPLALALLAAQEARAVSGLYTQVGLGFGSYNSSNLITEEQAGMGDLPQVGDGCCPKGGLAASFRLGYSIFGFAAPEFGIIGNGWDLGSNTGGGGMIGGGVRLFPVQFLTLVGLDDVDEFPIDIGIGALFGYTIVGKDFAYTGAFINLDLTVEYRLASYFSAGLRFDLGLPQFSDFAYTDYKNDRGRCLDSAGDQVLTNGDGRIPREGATCSGAGPSATFTAPQVVFTFHFDPFE